MLSSFRVSWRNLTRHKKRFLLTLIAIILGVTVMTSMFIAKSTFSKLMDEQDRLTAGYSDFRIQGTERFFPITELAGITEREEIKEGIATLTKQGFAVIETETPEQTTVRFTGISNFQNDLIELSVKAGDVTKEGLIITENTAVLWGKDVGDLVSFQDMGSLEVTAVVYEGGILNSPKTMEAAFFQDFSVIVPLDVLQEWTGLDNQISEYSFQVNDKLDQQELLAAYQKELADSALFVQPIVSDTQQYNDVEGLYFIFDLIAILSIFISGFIAFNMINTSIVERKNEIAIMKSLGYTNGDVIRLILREIAFLAILGTLFGLGIGVWFGDIVQDTLVTAIVTQNISYQVEIMTPVIISAIIGLCFPFVAAAFPLYKAGKTPILEAMSGLNMASHRKNKLNRARVIFGIICTGIGLIDNVWAFLFLFIGLVLLFPQWMKIIQLIVRPLLEMVFGFSGKQATRSVKQFENRNANTAAMLAIGVSLALFMSAALESLPDSIEKEIRATFGGDIIVEKETPWTESEIETLRNMEGIKKADVYSEIPHITWLSSSDELREFSIFSYRDNQDRNMFELVEVTDEASENPSIYIGERALAEMGAAVGDEFTFQTPAGEEEFFIKGSVQTAHYSGYTGFLEEADVREFMNWPLDYHVSLEVNDKDHIPIILAGLLANFEGKIINVDLLDVNIEQSKSGIAGMNDLMLGLLLLVIAISAIGISNTLFMNTLERTKELGTMRALGFTKAQVKTMIIAEGLLIGITGVIVGMLYGVLVIYLNTVSTQAPAFLGFSVPWPSLILAVAGGLAFTLLASWIPSYSASRISIKEAINYE